MSKSTSLVDSEVYTSTARRLGVVVDRSVLDALDVPWSGLEEGWLLVGNHRPLGLTVEYAVQSGPRTHNTPSCIEFDRENLAGKVLALRKQYGEHLVPVGIAHTHPPPDKCPSPDDLRADLEWIKDSPDPFVFCIVCGGLSWWMLRAGWTNYERLE